MPLAEARSQLERDDGEIGRIVDKATMRVDTALKDGLRPNLPRQTAPGRPPTSGIVGGLGQSRHLPLRSRSRVRASRLDQTRAWFPTEDADEPRCVRRTLFAVRRSGPSAIPARRGIARPAATRTAWSTQRSGRQTPRVMHSPDCATSFGPVSREQAPRRTARRSRANPSNRPRRHRVRGHVNRAQHGIANSLSEVGRREDWHAFLVDAQGPGARARCEDGTGRGAAARAPCRGQGRDRAW